MDIITPLLISLCITIAITPLVIIIANKLKLLDDKKYRYHPAQIHSGTIPRAGGLAIFFGFLIASLATIHVSPLLLSILISCFLLICIGLLDDIKDVKPTIRLGVIMLAITLVIANGAIIRFITNPITGGVLQLDSLLVPLLDTQIPYAAIGITFVWVLWATNIVGWSAGVDGQMPGFVTISALVIGLLSLRFSQHDPSQLWVTKLAMITVGSFLGFTFWNFYPQKIMPGYSGKAIAGFLLGILSILSYGKVGTALLVLGMPTIDALYTLFRRWRDKKPITGADRQHLHHLLLDMGWSKRKIALFYWTVSAILGAIALTVTNGAKFFIFLLVSVSILGFIIWVRLYTQSSKQRGRDNG